MSPSRDPIFDSKGSGTVAACRAFDLPSDPSVCCDLGGAGGFSGARLWRVSTGGQSWCVRRWPREYPDRRQLHFIHDVIRHVRSCGLDCFSKFRSTAEGTTVYAFGEHLWEASSWLRGDAVEGSPSREQLVAAMDTLGRFHSAVQRYANPTNELPLMRRSCSPGIASRLKMLGRWSSRDPDRVRLQAKKLGIDVAIIDMIPPFFVGLRRHGPALQQRLSAALRVEVSLVPCLRDIRREHVLFSGALVSGIVDYGSVNWENKSADVARLLGSLIGADRELWQQGCWREGLAMFRQHVDMSATEIEFTEAFHDANRLLSGFQWLEWLIDEGRSFDSIARVTERLGALLDTLEQFPLAEP